MRVSLCVSLCVCQVWVYWVGQYKEKVILRQKNALAGRHWSVRQEAACWVAWGVYVEHRRGKRHINSEPIKQVYIDTNCAAV